MKSARNTHKKTILLQWVLTCVIILLIPFISILINFFIGRKIINEQARNSNRVILSHMQNAIDDKLQSIRKLSYLFLLDDNILKLSSAFGQEDFFSRAQLCYEELNNYSYVYRDMSIMVCFPDMDYIVTNGVSNASSFIYNSMSYSFPGELLPYENWLDIVAADYSKSSYFLSDVCNYTNVGKDSLVYACSSPFVSQQSASYNILVSATTDFIGSDLEELSHRTFLLCDPDGNITAQFGSPMENVASLSLRSSSDYSTLDLNGVNYFCYYTPSSITDWTYVLCTPSSLYLKDSLRMRNVTLLSTLASLMIGIFMILYTQYRNYKPVKRLIDVIPSSIRGSERDEFRQLELYHGEMYRLNLFMQNKLDNISRNVRELYFYSRLKGVGFHSQERDIIKTLNLDFSGKHFAIVSVYADTHTFSQDDIMRNWELLQFAIGNVSQELLGDCFPYERIQDEFFHVFLFTLNARQEESWQQSGFDCFEQLFHFFQAQFHIDLFITVSPSYESFEQTAAHYADMLASFEYNYAHTLSGVYPAVRHGRDSAASHTRRNDFSRSINLSIFRNDFRTACQTVHEYISDLKCCQPSDIIVRYHVFSLIASILMDSGDYISQSTRDTIDSYLSDSFYCSSLEEYEKKINQLLLFLCGQNNAIGENSPSREDQLMKKIKNYVDNYYSDPNLNVTSVADAVGLSPNYMSKLFKSLTGEGLLSYINNVRINHARELLRITNINVDEIALMVGFSSPRSFRRNFQNLTGITATDYRNGVK